MSYIRPARKLKVRRPDGTERGVEPYLLPPILLTLAASALVASIFLPYWGMTLYAPQYPDDLKVDVYVDHLEGDVMEIDALNHYLGLPPLDEGGTFERQIAIPSILIFSAFLVAGSFLRGRLAFLAIFPTLTFPVVFLADLKYILHTYGQSVDPESALGGAIDPFSPPLFGEGIIGQFRTVAVAGPGLWLALLAVALAVTAFVLQHRLYSPLDVPLDDPDEETVAAPSKRAPSTAHDNKDVHAEAN